MQVEPPKLESRAFAAVPVFPLPKTVLFPGVMLPLQIFEPRYQQMLRDIMAGSRQFVLTCSELGEGDGLQAVGCLAQVMQVEQQAEGRSQILVRGEARVRLIDEQPEDGGYRRFRVQTVPPITLQREPGSRQALATLQQLLCQLAAAAAGRDRPLLEVLRASDDPLVVADYLAAGVVRDSVTQQAVLASTTLRARIDAMMSALSEVLLRLCADGLNKGRPN